MDSFRGTLIIDVISWCANDSEVPNPFLPVSIVLFSCVKWFKYGANTSISCKAVKINHDTVNDLWSEETFPRLTLSRVFSQQELSRYRKYEKS